MTAHPTTGAGSGPVGLLVVHGIGSQECGVTLNGLLRGIRLAYGKDLEIHRAAKDHAVLDGIGRRIHVFEVYWADLLRGKAVRGTFDFDRIFETVWFPLMNHRSGRLSPEVCSRRKVVLWTLVLAPLSSLLYAGFLGASFPAAFITGMLQAARNMKDGRRRISPGSVDPDRKPSILDDVMDQVAGDVFNYVHGLARAFPEETEQSRQLSRNVAEIHTRFVEAAERAVEQGCEEIQVLAHSLGTVIAFLGMCPENRPPESAPDLPQLTRFYTIGSPLEKIRFFWTRLVDGSRNGPAIAVGDRVIAVEADQGDEPTMKWQNFFSRLDLVSGDLQRFPGWPTPENLPARGLGGLITAHGAYNRNPDFLDLLADGLTGGVPKVRLSLARRTGARLVATAETLVLPAILLALAIMGLAVMGAMAWGTGWLVSQPLEWLDLAGWAKGVRWYFVFSVLFVLTVVGVLLGRGRAKELYARFWAPDKT